MFSTFDQWLDKNPITRRAVSALQVLLSLGVLFILVDAIEQGVVGERSLGSAFANGALTLWNWLFWPVISWIIGLFSSLASDSVSIPLPF